MTFKKIIVVGFLTFLILLSGVVYVTFSNNARIRVDNDKTTFYVPHEDYSWIWRVNGREYNKLFDGPSLMYRQTGDITIEVIINETGISKIIRTTPYIRGPIIIDTYNFNASLNKIEMFPISHEVEIINGSGFFYRYEVRNLIYGGETYKLTDETTLKFGRKMHVELNSNYKWAWVYSTGIVKAQYDIPTDDEKFNVRLFDPDYGWLDVNISYPLNNSNFNQTDTNLTINATITCQGVVGALCGTVYALARYNLTASPNTAINITKGGLPFYILGEEGWNLSTATYDNVNISTQDTSPQGLFFSSDGTKLYEIGDTGPLIYQYTCSAWDLGSCEYDEVSLSTEDSEPRDLFFSSDGTKMYELGITGLSIFQYTCTTGWDLGSCSYDEVSLSLTDFSPTDFFFSSDGTKFYELGTNSDVIRQYTCSAWDLGSCSYDEVSIDTIDGSSSGLFFSSDGTKMYEMGWSSRRIFQFTCTTGWDLSSCTYDSVFIDAADIYPRDLFFNPDGTKMYELGNDNDLIYQLTLGGAENPQSQTLEQGQSWNVSWILNVTSADTESYLIDVFFNSSYGNSLVPNNDTENRQVNLNPSVGDPDINWSSNIGALRFLNCSPDWEFYPTNLGGQTTSISAINATNNGTATGSFQIKYFTTLNTGWELFSCRIASESDPKNDATNCITISDSFQTIWSGVGVNQNKSIWLYGNCSYVSANPGVSIDMQVV